MSKSNLRIDGINILLIIGIIAVIAVIYTELNNPAGMEAEKITNMILDEHKASFANNGFVDEHSK